MKRPKPSHCPCGSTTPYTACCGKYLDDDLLPSTAAALMRSRYCAYTRNNSDYLKRSWHQSTRPLSLDLTQPPLPEWQGLKIFRAKAGGENDTTGSVEFVARYKIEGKIQLIHEHSRFIKEGQRWYYVDGTLSQTGLNTPCPCGSSKKFKRCCGKA